jgi:hypothetical protein
VSGLGDYPNEMLPRDGLDDRVLDAVFSGRSPGNAEVGWLACLVEDARLATSGPAPQPGVELASVFMAGISTEKGELPVTAASNASGPGSAQASGLPKWRKVKMTIAEALAALFAKIGALGAAAKVGLATAAVVAVTGAAGAAGVLPGPAQDAFDKIGGGAEHQVVTDTSATDTDTSADTDTGAEFGTKVSEDAKDGGVDGQQISHDARDTFQPETPAGPPSSLPAAVPDGVTTGPPEGTPTGPPEGTPSGAPDGTPTGPPGP